MRVKTSGSSPFEWPLWGKKKLGSTPSASAIFASRLEPTRLVPLSYFCTCWNERSSSSASAVRDMPSARRCPRINLPTCMSTGSGDFAAMAGLFLEALQDEFAQSDRVPFALTGEVDNQLRHKLGY